jgi:hypothetical protein
MLSVSNKAQAVFLQVRLLFPWISYHKSGAFAHCNTVRQIIWSMQTTKPFIWLLYQHPQLHPLMQYWTLFTNAPVVTAYKDFIFPFQHSFTFFILFCAQTHQRTKWRFCEFNDPTWWERRQLIGSLHCNLRLLGFGRNSGDCPHSCRSGLDRPPKLRWVRGSLDSGCWMCSSHMGSARVGTNCKNIYCMRHCIDWQTVVVFGCALLSVFVPFLPHILVWNISVVEWIFSMAYCSLPSVRNWKYAAYRGTGRAPAVDDDEGKEDTAIRLENYASNSRPDPHQKYTEAVSYLDPL